MTEEIERAVEASTAGSDKKLLITIAIIAIVFAAFFVFRHYQNTTDQVVTIDDLHQMNLNGELKEEQGYVYNGFSFVFNDGLWYTKIQINEAAFQVPLHFGPRDVEGITIKGAINESFNTGSDVYITFNPLSENLGYVSLASSELAQNMVTAIKRRPVGACDRNETTACSDRPIITCETTTNPVIYLLQKSGPEIELRGNCMILRGLEYDLVKAVDHLLLQWYGIMQ